MSTLAVEPLALRVEFDADTMWLELADGRRLGVPLAYFPRLLRATSAQRNDCIISGGGTGLHWEDLDEVRPSCSAPRTEHAASVTECP